MDYTQLGRSLNRPNEMLRMYENSKEYDAIIADALRESFAGRWYSIEIAWKTFGRHLIGQGFVEAATGSPKSIMHLAFSSGLIPDAAQRIRYIDARQNTAHEYSEENLDAVIEGVGDFFDDAVVLYENMAPELDMTEEQYAEAKRLLPLHLPDTAVWVYGSRAVFKARPAILSFA